MSAEEREHLCRPCAPWSSSQFINSPLEGARFRWLGLGLVEYAEEATAVGAQVACAVFSGGGVSSVAVGDVLDLVPMSLLLVLVLVGDSSWRRLRIASRRSSFAACVCIVHYCMCICASEVNRPTRGGSETNAFVYCFVSEVAAYYTQTV